MAAASPDLLIVTDDVALGETLGGKLQQWGARVWRHDPREGQALLTKAVDVILVDVRHHAEAMLRGLARIRDAMPCAETVLINNSENINASMAGMRAGASDELTVPFDMEALRRKMAEAFRRSRARKARKHRHPLVTAFEDAMSAAAFAESGEFETAREMLSASDAAGKSDGAEGEKQGEGSLNSNASKR